MKSLIIAIGSALFGTSSGAPSAAPSPNFSGWETETGVSWDAELEGSSWDIEG